MSYQYDNPATICPGKIFSVQAYAKTLFGHCGGETSSQTPF